MKTEIVQIQNRQSLRMAKLEKDKRDKLREKVKTDTELHSVKELLEDLLERVETLETGA